MKGELIATGDYLDQPGQMEVVDDRLVVLDRSAPMVHVFHLGGAHLGSFGQKGEGPGEYRSAVHVQRDAKDPRDVWIFDRTLGRMSRLRFGQAPLPELQEVVNLNAGTGVFLHPVWLGDTTLVVSAISPTHSDGRLLLTGRTGRVMRMIGKPPRHPGSAAIPTTVLQHAYEGPLTVRPDRSHFALATRQADRLEIYRADGTQVAEVVGSTGFLPEFEVRERAEGVSMAAGDDLRVGYVGIASTNERIYALFSGELRSEAGANSFLGREVHVFNWSGKKIARLELDALAVAITVTPDGRQLFAIRHDPEPSVARYMLPPSATGS
ncbi:MAG TPA: BF3164 family lipoprotein [Longimicrobium sp.]|nr:BF3164 family lipoprotein [Longimicrobium sp.]